jgi:hypothetical protein
MFGLGLGIGLGQNVAALGGGGAAAWVPTDLSTALFAWWTAADASTVNTGSSNVWANKATGTTPYLTQATGANRGTYTSGTKLSFDSTDELELASGPTVWDAIAVITTNSSSASYRTLLWDAVGSHACLLETGSNRLGAYNSSTTNFCDSGLTIATSTQAIIHVRMDGSRNVSMSLNGGTLTSTITTLDVAENAINTVGNATGGSQAFGDIHEITLTNSLLSTSSGAELDKAIGSAAWRWSLQSLLPGGHPYKSAAP